MDQFRQEQKRQSPDGSPNKHGRCRPFGCPCCRKIAHLARHKRITRRLARSRLARALLREVT